MNAFEVGLAVLASAAYREGRLEGNYTPLSPGAVRLPGALGYTSDLRSGFEASAFQYQGQIVIAYSGTDPESRNDWTSNILLGLGLMEKQLKLAADFYQAVKAQYGSDVTFTGHSLGGGLAALMGVFFNKQGRGRL